ncbi:fimbrial biogenesis chaperone [Stenotrophomonas rhizophila]|uniref:fimbrial biogenesis chaperone n=1 Tax=Stenotrophomonas rhizophila TaxID=216778 RepID=UPI001AEBC835|nr:fimbria/pilus periplasmic chaperone [Stenotrophomonas rhizophila]
MAHPDLLIRACLLLALLAPAAAQALDISPLRVALRPDQQDAELWLHNETAQPWSGQARLYRWEQSADAERLTPAQDVVVSPTRLALAPNARQRVRVVRIGAAPTAEQGYRLVLRAAPGSPPLQVSLPVFVAGPQPRPAPALSADLRDAAGHALLALYNGGTGHARLADLTFIGPDGRATLLLPELAGYVLAGSTRLWALPGPATAYAGGRFRARIGDAEPADIPAASPPIAPDRRPGL